MLSCDDDDDDEEGFPEGGGHDASPALDAAAPSRTDEVAGRTIVSAPGAIVLLLLIVLCKEE